MVTHESFEEQSLVSGGQVLGKEGLRVEEIHPHLLDLEVEARHLVLHLPEGSQVRC